MSLDPPSPAAADTLRWATRIVIPTDWTPGQALAVFELLDDLRDKRSGPVTAARYSLSSSSFQEHASGHDHDGACNDPSF